MIKYRFEPGSEDDTGASFTKLPDLLFFNIRRTARQSGGREVYFSETHINNFIEIDKIEKQHQKQHDEVADYTREQMELALQAIHAYRRRHP